MQSSNIQTKFSALSVQKVSKDKKKKLSLVLKRNLLKAVNDQPLIRKYDRSFAAISNPEPDADMQSYKFKSQSTEPDKN